MKLIVHTDGGARGNPGPSAVGVVIEEITQMQGAPQKKKIIQEFGKTIGETTNNVAEYTAVIEALEWITNNPINQSTNQPIIQFYLDSTLVVNQLNGIFKVKDARLRELLMKAKILEQGIDGSIQYNSVPREQNTRADYLVNKALDDKLVA
ncbi:MAG TPA: ribonuclease HI family protein [Patescibacteria group bacterium]|jgi:ribonuclease HI|nr:ribonuclease HI family protein [Patescibacteria group bacterium]